MDPALTPEDVARAMVRALRDVAPRRRWRVVIFRARASPYRTVVGWSVVAAVGARRVTATEAGALYTAAGCGLYTSADDVYLATAAFALAPRRQTR